MCGLTQSSIGLVSSSLVAVLHCSSSNHCGNAAKVYFDSILPEFIEWVQRNASVSSSFPWLSECTNFVSKRPTGAPTVHVVVSTLTHTTSSIITTRPGNFGGAVPSIKTTTRSSAQATQDASTEVKPSSTTQPQTTASTAQKTSTTAAEQMSSGDLDRTSASSVLEASPGTTVQQASPTTSQQVSSTAVQQIPSTVPQQSPSISAEQGQTTVAQQPTVQPSSAADNTGSPSAAQPINTENNEGTTSGANAVSGAAPHPSATTNAAGSADGAQVPSGQIIPTNSQAATSGGYTEPQQVDVTTLNSANNPTESSSVFETTIAVAPVLTLAATTIAANPSSEYIIGSQTLAPGGPAITIGETTYSLAPFASAIVENGQTRSLAPVLSASVVPQITLGSSVITANPSEGFVYASQTISAGGPAITVDGKTYSLAASGATTYVVANGITQQPTASQTVAPVLTIGNSAVTANSDSVFVVGSQTLEAGGSAIVIGETTYSLSTSGSSTLIVQNGITSALVKGSTAGIGPSIASSAEVHIVASVLASKVTVESSVVTQSTVSGFVVAGQTLSPGGPAVEVQGTTYSLAPSATAVLVNGVASALPGTSTSPVVSVTTDAVAPALSVGSSVITPNAASEYVIETRTLAPGGPAIEVQGTTYSLAPSATALLVNGVTSTLSAAESTAVIIAGQTLSRDTEIVVQGTTYSLAPSYTAIIINGHTSALPTSTVKATPVFVVGSTTLKPGDAVTVQGTTYSIPPFPALVSGSTSEAPVVVINGKTSTLPASQGTGAAVLSGLQRTTSSLSGSRVTGSATTTSTQGTESVSGSQSVASTSTAGVARSVQRSAGDTVVALIMGVVGMVLL